MKSRTIYLIHDGLNCDNVVKSLNHYSDQHYEFLKSKSPNLLNLKQKNDYSLTDNGIKEILNLKKNEKMDNLINNNNLLVLCSFKKSSIESAFILFNNLKNNTIFKGEVIPILNITKNNFKTLRDVEDFKRDFGNTNTNETSKYWNELSSNSGLLEIKTKIPKINWNFSNSNYTNDFNNYKYSKFEKNLTYFLDNYNKDIVIISDYIFIKHLLKNIKDRAYKFNKKKDIIEYSSCYAINIEFENNKINYKKFNKFYPTQFNYNPLKKENSGYTYNFKKEFVLHNADIQKYIDIYSLRKLFISQCIKFKTIQKILDSSNDKLNSKNNPKNSKNNKHKSNSNDIMNVIKKIENS